MKFEELVKNPLAWLVGYLIIKELNQQAKYNAMYFPQQSSQVSRNIPTNLANLDLIASPTPKPSPDLQTKEDPTKMAESVTGIIKKAGNEVVPLAVGKYAEIIIAEVIQEYTQQKILEKPNFIVLPTPRPSSDLQTKDDPARMVESVTGTIKKAGNEVVSLVAGRFADIALSEVIKTEKWLKLIHHPSIVIILGGRGKGKSALGYMLLEYLRWIASVYVVGLPKEARNLLPDWIGMVASLEDVPPKSIVLVDEAYMPYHARSSMAAEAKAMSQLVNLSRQREQTLIFVSQEARQIDRNIASSVNVVIFKDLGMFQLKFDRPEFNKIESNAQQAFATVSGDKRRWAYVYSPDSVGLMENSLPTFWHDKLSHIFATGGEVIARAPRKTPLIQRIERAKELSRQGLSLGKIAKLMGVSKPTIKNYLEGYPYKA